MTSTTTDDDGAGMIVAERARQIGAEGYDHRHDDQHTDGEIADAATAYLQGDGGWWPWEPDGFKPSWNGRIGNLVKAGALIAAEIDRLQRTEAVR